ncbi:FxSxx-COOH system tetratricopeptide repeat protein, partial [Nonomuraea sp. H19]|uniref:FxSxx-COOH system tetratricopeptide repeat protein n=1 Tax=Nonomuraea sp. H19 TaxID=3452206 RepID=UPI003F8A950A
PATTTFTSDRHHTSLIYLRKQDGALSLEAGSLLAAWQVPVGAPVRRLEEPRAWQFVGRAQALEQLADMLPHPGEPAMVRQVVQGMGGVGKSELVRHYIRTHKDRYQVAWWITADSPENLQQGFSALAAAIHPPTGVLRDAVLAAAWALDWLQAHPGWLVVLDNVEDPVHVREYLDRLLAGHVVITTRRDAYWPNIPTLTVNVLDEQPALQLMRGIIEPAQPIGPKEQDDLCIIAAELGYLPLALEQASAYIRESRVSPGRYLERLHRHPVRMYVSSVTGGESERTMGRLWDTHLDAIRGRDKSEQLQAEHLLRTLACYASDNIPRSLLGDESDNLEFDDALRLLASYSMITRSGTGDEEMLSMHRLFQSVVYNGLDYNEPASQAARATALSWLSQALPDDPQFNVDDWPKWRELFPHIDAIALRYRNEDEPADLGRVLSMTAVFALEQGQYRRAHDLASRALLIVEAELGPDHPTVSNYLGNLASCLRALGRPAEAVPLEQRALVIIETAHGAEHPEFAMSLGNLAESFRALGRLAEAVPLFKRALAIVEAALGPDHLTVAIYLGNLASCFRSLGRPAEAVPLQQQMLAIFEAVLGPDHPSVAIALGNLAGSYNDLGRHAEEISLKQRALAIFEAVLGPDHPTVAIALENLAGSFSALGRPAEAVPLEQRALVIIETALGSEHPEFAMALGNLASSIRMLGRPAEAVPLFKRALAIVEAALGPNHPIVATVLDNLALSFSDLGRNAEAVPLKQRAWAIVQETRGYS